MFFLIRSAFWLSVVLALLPIFAGKDAPTQQTVAQQSSLGAGEALEAASATVSDLSGFCDRQPEACLVGSQAAVAFGQKAQAGAKILYDYLNDRTTPKATGSVTVRTNNETNPTAVPLPPVRKVVPESNKTARGATSSRETLVPGDLAPAWNSPSLHKDGATKHAG